MEEERTKKKETEKTESNRRGRRGEERSRVGDSGVDEEEIQ